MQRVAQVCQRQLILVTSLSFAFSTNKKYSKNKHMAIRAGIGMQLTAQSALKVITVDIGLHP